MHETLQWYAKRLSGNRLPSLLQELAEAIEDEEDKEQLRRLSSSLREMGSIAANKGRVIK